MNIVIIPTYKEIFSEEPPSLESLIEGVPTELIVMLISVMNAELYLSSVEIQPQIKLLNFLLQRQTQQVRKSIYYKIQRQFSRKNIDEFAIFSVSINLEFLHFSLTHYHEDKNFIDTSPEQELKIFKAYLLIAQQVFNRMKIEIDTESPVDYFRKNTWPILIGQFQLNHPYNYFLGMIKAKCFFDALEFESNYSEYVHLFTKRYGDPNSFTYIFRFGNTLQQSHIKDESKKFAQFSIKSDASSVPFFDELCLNLEEYASNFKIEKLNYNGLKDKPLFKINENSYVVINWNFLSRKIYDGMLFDFHKRSGIQKEDRFNEFIAFKKFISEESIENYLFKRLISACFKNKHSIIQFDNGETSGHPDAYVRVGKKIFLFEIKDAFFPSKVVDSISYNKIKEAIDQKYNSKKKGTGQIIKQLRRMKEKSFESNSYEELHLKTRNFIIYPIIIYTDPFFSLPGIGKYLQEEFLKIVKNEKLDLNFQRIKPLSFIDIDFFIDKLNQLKRKDYSLSRLIDLSENELLKREKRFQRTISTNDLMALNDNFESLCFNHLDTINSEKNYVRGLFDDLNLIKGLAD